MNIANSFKSLAVNETKATAAVKADPLASKDTFLQLLVAQMRNQDPLQPTDGTQFVTQLAQFSGLEQSMELNQEVIGVRQAVEALTEIVKNQGEPTA